MGELRCVELVELVTDYLEGELGPDAVARVRAHLASCDGCAAYVEQMRTTVQALTRLAPEHLSAADVGALLDTFRRWAAHDGTAR